MFVDITSPSNIISPKKNQTIEKCGEKKTFQETIEEVKKPERKRSHIFPMVCIVYSKRVVQ